MRAVARGAACQTVPTVTPGGDFLLRVDGWPKVERVLQLVDAIAAAGIDPGDVSPEHWRHVHNRLADGETPRTHPPETGRTASRGRNVQYGKEPGGAATIKK